MKMSADSCTCCTKESCRIEPVTWSAMELKDMRKGIGQRAEHEDMTYEWISWILHHCSTTH